MYFGHKNVETGSNCSHELATFLLKYQVPLTYLTYLMHFNGVIFVNSYSLLDFNLPVIFFSDSL